MVWECADEARKTKAVKVIMKMNVKGKTGRGRQIKIYGWIRLRII